MDLIRANTLLNSLNQADDPLLFKNLVEFSAKRQTRLHLAGEPAGHVYFPVAGMISLLTVMKDGQSVETGVIGYDGAAGFNSVLSGRNANCEAIVQIDMDSFRISKAAFKTAYDNSTRVRQVIHIANEALIEQAQQNAACHALHSAEGRFARWLMMANDYAGQKALDLTQEFVAEMIGVQRATVSILAVEFQKQDLIRYSRGHVSLLDHAGLMARCCECYDSLRDSKRGLAYRKPAAVPPGVT